MTKNYDQVQKKSRKVKSIGGVEVCPLESAELQAFVYKMVADERKASPPHEKRDALRATTSTGPPRSMRETFLYQIITFHNLVADSLSWIILSEHVYQIVEV